MEKLKIFDIAWHALKGNQLSEVKSTVGHCQGINMLFWFGHETYGNLDKKNAISYYTFFKELMRKICTERNSYRHPRSMSLAKAQPRLIEMEDGRGDSA